MTTLLKTAVGKVIGIGPSHGSKLPVFTFIQGRSIMGKSMRAAVKPPPEPKPGPFNYVEKDYTYFRSLFDRTTHRLDENSKVVVVEGPVAVGKTAFAANLAADLGMKHFPEADMNIHYCQNGVDLRSFDKDIPEDARTFDHINFNMWPNHRNAGNFQIMMYIARYGQYIDALAHLLNTGQGVVLERSPYSDFVFLEAMYACNYISAGVRSVYYELRANTIEELLRPHLVIYLDAPADKVCQLIKNRNLKHEVNGTALSDKFLCEMERQYKNKYLRDISTHAEMLCYDWTGGGDAEVVVEDIERFDFDKYTEREEPKMKDWRFPREVEWADARMKFTNHKHYMMNLFNIPRLDVPELILGADDSYERDQVVYAHPALEYMPGYNAKAGDKNILTKNTMPKYTVFF